MFEQILEIIGPREEWPPDVIHYLWRLTPRGPDFLHYKERFRLMLFLYINEVPFTLARRWCQRLNLLRDDPAIEHIQRLYATFHYQYIKGIQKYSAYNVRLGYDIFCSGHIHYYKKK